MNEGDFQTLKARVAAFHAAMKVTDFTSTELNLHHFPSECCHHACKLLGIYLFDCGFPDIRKMVGKRPGDAHSEHLWLEVDGVVVDITAYQFGSVNKKVIVERSSDWHSRLLGEPRRFGMENELLGEFMSRMKQHYNTQYNRLYDNVADLANELAGE